jgi:hypothetical protein
MFIVRVDSPEKAAVFTVLLTLFFAVLLAFALLGLLSDQQSKSSKSNLTPGLQLLPGDIKWQNESGHLKVYFPVTSSIVLSLVISAIFWFFR